jgi:hypothetical protein
MPCAFPDARCGLGHAALRVLADPNGSHHGVGNTSAAALHFNQSKLLFAATWGNVKLSQTASGRMNPISLFR